MTDMMASGGYQTLPSREEAGTSEPPLYSMVPDGSPIIQVAPDTNNARWNHIEDLDTFFTRIYHYHQNHGFGCMALQQILELLQYLFVILFSTYLLRCVDYAILFRDKPVAGSNDTMHTKITLDDAVKPISVCAANLGGGITFCLVVSLIFWALRCIRVVFNLIQYVDIKHFYTMALRISPAELDNMTWHEVQQRVIDVQKDHQMVIHKRELTELDIYNRILRHTNYLVAMVNKNVLPLSYRIPFVGESIFFPQSFRFNLELVLFWGPYSPFKNSWHLHEEYKKIQNRHHLAESLSRQIFWLGVLNLLLFPFVFIWQLLYLFFMYADLIKREPGVLGARMWSQYARLYLRHFNELDHELNARLCRGYKPASQYMTIFTSHVTVILAKNVTFFAGSILAVLVALTIWDEDFLSVSHILSAITLLSVIVALCRSVIPDDYLVFCPEILMRNILAHVHYMPNEWLKGAQTYAVRDAFANLFQYKAVNILEELLSPLLTPFILMFSLRRRSLDIVDFLRNFSVSVTGVGDVCSFAMMDVKKHGNAMWFPPDVSETLGAEDVGGDDGEDDVPPPPAHPDQYRQTENGKMELSLVHFTLTNPHWQPEGKSAAFLDGMRTQVERNVAPAMMAGVGEADPMILSSPSVALSLPAYGALMLPSMIRGRGVTNCEGPLSPPSLVLSPAQSRLMGASSVYMAASTSMVEGADSIEMVPPVTQPSFETSAAKMSVSALLMHDMHQRRVSTSRVPIIRESSLPPIDETRPLLHAPPHQSPTSL